MKLNNNTVFDCSKVDISKIQNEAGNITVIENGERVTKLTRYTKDDNISKKL